MSDEVPASVAQVTPVSDHPHIARMREEIAEEVKRQGGNGGGGNMSELERRVGNLETDIRSIRDSINIVVTDIAVIKSNYATKTDIADLKTDISKEMLTQTRWIIATLIALIGISVAIQRFLPTQNAQQPNPLQQSLPLQPIVAPTVPPPTTPP